MCCWTHSSWSRVGGGAPRNEPGKELREDINVLSGWHKLPNSGRNARCLSHHGRRKGFRTEEREGPSPGRRAWWARVSTPPNPLFCNPATPSSSFRSASRYTDALLPGPPRAHTLTTRQGCHSPGALGPSRPRRPDTKRRPDLTPWQARGGGVDRTRVG